jgi:hypothetical protein
MIPEVIISSLMANFFSTRRVDAGDKAAGASARPREGAREGVAGDKVAGKGAREGDKAAGAATVMELEKGSEETKTQLKKVTARLERYDNRMKDWHGKMSVFCATYCMCPLSNDYFQWPAILKQTGET